MRLGREMLSKSGNRTARATGYGGYGASGTNPGYAEDGAGGYGGSSGGAQAPAEDYGVTGTPIQTECRKPLASVDDELIRSFSWLLHSRSARPTWSVWSAREAWYAGQRWQAGNPWLVAESDMPGTRSAGAATVPTLPERTARNQRMARIPRRSRTDRTAWRQR